MPDYVISADEQLPTTPIEQWNANLAAIRTVKEIEAEGRSATPEEQTILAKYSGFGNSAFSQAFSRKPTNPAMGKRGQELRELVTPEEYESIRGSRLNAFFTSSNVINQMWSGLMDMGAGALKDPVVLEPSAGSGRFLGLQPPDMARRSKRIAVELDELTGSIVKHAYPDTQVHVAGYEDVRIPDDYVDIAISNVPFGNYAVYDEEYSGQDQMTRSIHNYFFGKTVDKLKPGGVAAFVTTHYTMDSQQAKDFREHIAEQADFLGAVRLPEKAFPDTDVVTDIIYLRKRDPADTHPVNRSWVETEKVELPTKWAPSHGRYGPMVGLDKEPYSVNRYFVENPDQVLGVPDGTGKMYSVPNSYTVKAKGAFDSPENIERFTEATGNIVKRAPRVRTRATNAQPAQDVMLKRTHASEMAARPGEGKYRVNQGTLEQVRGGTWQPAEKSRDAQGRIEGMMGLRDDVRSLMDLELSGDADEEAVTRQRAVARQSYEDFVTKHGDLNAKENKAAIAGDPDAHFLRGLEVLKNDKWRGSDVFQRRTFSPGAAYTAETPEEALAVSLNAKGRVDVDYMAEILGQPKNAVVQALVSSGQIYLNPETRKFERRAEYLSGTVKEKLQRAREAAEQNPSYQANIASLEDVQPERVGAGDIYLSMGSSWIPEDLMNEGLAHVLSGGNDRNQEVRDYNGEPKQMVTYSAETGVWGPSSGMPGRRTSLNATWGTGEVPASKIIEHAVTNRPIRVTTKDDDDKSVYDEVATRAAEQKVRELRDQFGQWVWEDPERTAMLEDRYNESQNVSIPKEYDASHMTFPGMSAKWQGQIFPHQREAAARVVQDGNVMMAHEVGFGKTTSMIAGAMERKRLGLTQKPMFVLPNATAAQFAADYRELYPGARILFEEEVGPENRKAFLDRVRNNDWDAVLVTYSQFERIPVTLGTLDKYRDLNMEQLEAGLQEAGQTGNEYREKQIQALIKKADTAFKKKRAKLEEMFDEGAVPFESLGVDQLFVDEADNFKNLAFFTSLENIKGLNPSTQSMRGWDMFMKTQLLQGRTGQIRNAKGEPLRGGVVFATGSSISNSLAEMWTMMRYLQLDELERRGLDTFDAWASNYGRMENAIEVRASGKYAPTTRFSKFANMPELSALWQGVADIRVKSELPIMLERQPRLVDEEGNPKRINVQAPKTPAVEAYMKHVGTRAEELDGDTQRDNMLKLSGAARKASLDIRFAPDFEESSYPWPPDPEQVKVEANPKGKLPLMVQNVADVYHQETEDKGTQLVFLDMGTPSSTEKVGENTSKAGDNEDDLDLDREEQAHLKETYDMIRRSLEAKGVPREEIAFIHDYKKNDQKQRLFREVREGKKRVLLGSTNKLGVGVNVQDRLAAIHHVDVPWRPRDVEQREGRIIRPGNEVYGPKIDPESKEIIDKGRGVRIYKYVQQGSFDEFMWQAVEKKAAGIKAITKRHVTARESDDIDEFVLSAAEARALSSGDPRAVELVTLETQLAGMRLDRSAYESQRTNAQSQIGTLTNRVDVLSKQLPNYKRDADVAAQVLENDSFVAFDSEGKALEKRADAEKAFKERLAKTPFGSQLDLGTYKGFKVHGANKDTGFQVVLESVGTGQKYSSNSFDNPETTNVITRADNIIKGMVSSHEDKASQLSGAQDSLRAYKAQAEKPYDQLQELVALERKAKNLRVAVQGVDESQEGQALEFSQAQLVQEDIQQATDEDMIDAEQRVLAQVMERRREDRSYQTPTGPAFDALVSESLQDILQDRRQQEVANVDADVDADLMENVPDAIPEDQREKAAAAVLGAFDIDPERVKEDLSPEEIGDVVERVAERIQEEAEDNQAEGKKVTVISLSDVDAMLQEEIKEEGVEEEATTTSPASAQAYDAQDDADEDEDEEDFDADDWEEDPGYADAMDDLERADAVVEEGVAEISDTDTDTDYGVDEEEQTTQPNNRRLVSDPMDEELEVDLSDPVERGLMAGDALGSMSPEVRNTRDVLADRLGDLLDEYELTILARRLGENPTEEELEQAEAKLRRQGALNQGQGDMFGATADEPDAMVVPEPVMAEPEAMPEPEPVMAEPEAMPEPEPVMAEPEAMPEPEPESPDMAGQAEVAEETLADRIRNFGDTGFVDPDDYERVMDAHFDGDIAEVDSLEDLEDLEAHVEREPATGEMTEEAKEELAGYESTPTPSQQESLAMTEEAQEELAGYESAPTPSQQESLAMTEEDIERLRQYDSASLDQGEEPKDSPNEYSDKVKQTVDVADRTSRRVGRSRSVRVVEKNDKERHAAVQGLTDDELGQAIELYESQKPTGVKEFGLWQDGRFFLQREERLRGEAKQLRAESPEVAPVAVATATPESVGFADEREYRDLLRQVAMSASEKGRLDGLPEDDRIEMASGIMKDAMPYSITKLADMSPRQNLDRIIAENNAEIERRKMEGMESVGDMTDLAAVEAALQSVGREYQESHAKQSRARSAKSIESIGKKRGEIYSRFLALTALSEQLKATPDTPAVGDKAWDESAISVSVGKLPAQLADNEALQNAFANAPEDNQRVEFDSQIAKIIATNVRSDTGLYKRYTEDSEFKESLNNQLFNEAKEKAGLDAKQEAIHYRKLAAMADADASRERHWRVRADHNRRADEFLAKANELAGPEDQPTIDARENLYYLNHTLRMATDFTPINPVEVERYTDRVQKDIDSGRLLPEQLEVAREAVRVGNQKLEAYHEVTLSNPKLRQRQQRELSRMANALADPRRVGQQEELAASFKDSFSSGPPSSQKLVKQIIDENVQSGKGGAWAAMQRAIGGSESSTPEPEPEFAPVAAATATPEDVDPYLPELPDSPSQADLNARLDRVSQEIELRPTDSPVADRLKGEQTVLQQMIDEMPSGESPSVDTPDTLVAPEPEPEPADPGPALTPVAEVKEADAETSSELASICRDYGDKTPEDLVRDIDSFHSRLDTLEKRTGLDLDKLPANAVALELNDDGSVSVQTAPTPVESDQQSATEKERQERQPVQPPSTADTPPPSGSREQQPRREQDGGLPASDEPQATEWDSLSMAQKQRAVNEINAVLEKLAVARALNAQVQQGASLSDAVERYCALLTRPLAAVSVRLANILGRRRGRSPSTLGSEGITTKKTGLRGRRAAPKHKERDWAAEAAGESGAVPAPVIYVR